MIILMTLERKHSELIRNDVTKMIDLKKISQIN